MYARTDQVLAGLEAAVDPNGDGDAHDGARIALVGVAEPFSSFSDGPLARAGRGALALDTLVVAPAGNDGPAGPGYGSIAAPAGTSGVLGVAAADSRGRSPTVHVLLRAGLRVLASGETPLGGAVGPDDVVTAPVVALPRRQIVAVTRGNALARLFDGAGYSRVAGKAVLLPSGPTTPEAVRELAAAGTRAVLVDGPIPAGSLGLDETGRRADRRGLGAGGPRRADVPRRGDPGRARRRRSRARRRTSSSGPSRRSRASGWRSTAAPGRRSPLPGSVS